MNIESTTQEKHLALKILDHLCAKSKKICALCETKLGLPTKEEIKEAKSINGSRRYWVSQITFKHPVFPSKKYKVCGDCYGDLLRRQD